MLPAFTIGNVVALFLAGIGVYLLQWGIRHGIDEDSLLGFIFIVVAWGVTQIGPLL